MFTKLPRFLANDGSPYDTGYSKYLRSLAYGFSIPNAVLNSHLFLGRYFSCAQPPIEFNACTWVLA